MPTETWCLFLGVSLLAVLTPGPTMLAIVGHSVSSGLRPTLPVIVGNGLGIASLMGASIAGVATLLAALPHGPLVLRAFGAIFLFWQGVRAWRMGDAPSAETPPAGRPLLRGFLLAWSNPKALLFFGAVLPQFLTPGYPLWLQFLSMTATFVGLELVVTTSAATLAGRTRRIGSARAARMLRRSGGVLMMGAAVLLALSARNP